LNFDEVPEFLKPRLRLFLSADIVGSTALKQAPAAGSAPAAEQRTTWFSKIQGFYFEAHQAFAAECERARTGGPSCIGDIPKLWKTVGDEVLFVKVVRDHREVVTTLRCWIAASEQIRSFVQKDNKRLDIKCTAWLAGFPFRNSEVAVPTQSTEIKSNGDWYTTGGDLLNRIYGGEEISGVTVDYIGPSIDIGFRLATFSTARRFVISADVAYLLSIANPAQMAEDPVFGIYYDGSHPLKGALGGLKYPIFWLDMSPSGSLDRYKDNITNLTTINRDRLREFCLRFYQEHEDYTFRPFIVSDSEQQLSERPAEYDDLHGALVKNFKIESQAEEEFKRSVAADSDGSDGLDLANQQMVTEFLKKLDATFGRKA
jgi:hypothetical protein